MSQKSILGIFAIVSLTVITGLSLSLSNSTQLSQQRIIGSKAAETTAVIIAPKIGVSYTHHDFLKDAENKCTVNDTGILFSYHQPGVREKVKTQLTQMKNSEIQIIRLILWHMSNIQPADKLHRWGPIPSAGGKLSEPYRTNFINFLSDVKAAGFTDFRIVFAPMFFNSPLWDNTPNGNIYNPANFDENWGFIQDARLLAKQYGPINMRFDLLNESGPNDYWLPAMKTQVTEYLLRMYKNYVTTYGNSDISISYIAPGNDLESHGNVVQNLVNVFKQLQTEGLSNAYPLWFEPHTAYSYEGNLYGLRNLDDVLKANNLTSIKISIGEAGYNHPEVVRSINDFLKEGRNREIQEVNSWYLLTQDSSCNVRPPYRASSYIDTLQKNITDRKGTITCTPNSVGSNGQVTVKATWENLRQINNSAVAHICVSVNGDTPSLFAAGGGVNGQGEGVAPWIYAPNLYIFTLYDQYGTSYEACNGTPLAYCTVKTNVSAPTPTASPSPTQALTACTRCSSIQGCKRAYFQAYDTACSNINWATVTYQQDCSCGSVTSSDTAANAACGSCIQPSLTPTRVPTATPTIISCKTTASVCTSNTQCCSKNCIANRCR